MPEETPSQENAKNIEQFREALGEADALKEKRNAENQAVAEAKKRRDELQAQLEPYKKQLAEKEKQIEAEDDAGNFRMMERDLERVEWALQTEANPRREKELSKMAKDIREKMAQARKVHDLKHEANLLWQKMNDMAMEAKAAHMAVVMHAKESDAAHKKMLEVRGQAGKMERSIAENLQKVEARQPRAEGGEHDRPRRERGERRGREPRQEGPTQLTFPAKAEAPGDLKEEADKIMEEFKKGKKISLDEIRILQSTGEVPL
jgi:uncharacterized coiled-coil DUF342 family protein